MAISYTVPNTFSALTVAESAKVNANETYTKSIFDGLEAGTSSFSKLKLDADPTSALEVTTKQYVDNYSTYRRPVLQYASATTVNVETGNNGTSGEARILFPDGTRRTETSATRINFVITRNAVFATTSGAQSGLRSSLSEAANTWYALYAVKVADSTTQWCTVGDTVLPLQANFATLNSNYGTNSWVYLGLIRNGDNSSTSGDILLFSMSGNQTLFRNNCVTAGGEDATGIRLATGSNVTSLTYTYTAGTGAAEIPGNVVNGHFAGTASARDTGVFVLSKTSGGARFCTWRGAASFTRAFTTCSVADSLQMSNIASVTTDTFDINLTGFSDSVLGVGSNPIL